MTLRQGSGYFVFPVFGDLYFLKNNYSHESKAVLGGMPGTIHITLKVIAIKLLAFTSKAGALNRCEIFWAGESATTYGENPQHSVLGLAVRNPLPGYAIEPWIDDDLYSLSYGGRTVTNWNTDYGSCDLYNDAGGETFFDCFSYYDTQYVIIQLGINHISGLAQDHGR